MTRDLALVVRDRGASARPGPDADADAARRVASPYSAVGAGAGPATRPSAAGRDVVRTAAARRREYQEPEE